MRKTTISEDYRAAHNMEQTTIFQNNTLPHTFITVEGLPLDTVKAHYIRHVLKKFRDNPRKACVLLNISMSAFYRYLSKDF